jgi:RecA-family ATPase
VTKEGEQADSDLREIEFLKNQYGPKGRSIVLRYERGIFQPVAGETSLDRAAREQRIDSAFMTCLTKLEEQHRPVSPAKTSPNYAPKVFPELEDGKAYLMQDYRCAMERLLNWRKIHVAEFGKASRKQQFLRSGSPEEKT